MSVSDATERDGAKADLAPHHARIARFERLQSLSRMMDSALRIPGLGVKFGLDSLIGLVPGIGDAATAAISLWIVAEARALGAPHGVLAKMLGRVAADMTFGAVPVVGDVFDVAFRANRRNVRALEDWLVSEGVIGEGGRHR